MDWVELDRRHVWHPFTQMAEWNDVLVIERAEGNYLLDTEGRRYLDGVSSLWVNVHGHNRPEINRAIAEQLGQVAHSTLLGLASPPSIALAAKLADLAPTGLRRVFYSDSGSTAVEIALKQAFQYWQHRGRPEKQRFAHLDAAYHGDTLGAVGVGGIELFHQVFGPLLVPGLTLATPAKVGLAAALENAESMLRRHGSELAAVIVEPLIQGAGGMLVHPRGYLGELAALCRRYQVLLIADEVATGFGRTGTMFACEQEGVTPDFLCLAKGITGGYLPLAATMTTDEVFEAFLAPRAASKTFFHGHTYTGNPLACAAALASLALFEQDQVLARLPAKIEVLRARMHEVLAPLRGVQEIRQCGLMVGVELAASDPAVFAGVRVCRTARDHGVILRPLGDVVVLMPPLSITEPEISILVEAVGRSIVSVLG